MNFSGKRRSVRTVAQLSGFGMTLFLLLSPVRMLAWGCEGHQAVALIAQKHLNRGALEQANNLLRAAPIDSTLQRWCSDGGSEPIVDSSTWADDIRKLRPETSPWHYIDIPRGARRGALANFCPSATGCVTDAIRKKIELVRNQGAGTQARADALRFIIHLVGDLHQPLHCSTNNDLGGNCVPITFFGKSPIETNTQTEAYSPNLHAVWDSSIIDHMKGPTSTRRWAATIDGEFTPQAKLWEKAGIDLDAWAWEGHELAESVVYATLPVAIPVDKPEPARGCSEDDHVSSRMLKLHERVSQKYVNGVAPTVDEQIAKAGVRLAMILNQIWP